MMHRIALSMLILLALGQGRCDVKKEAMKEHSKESTVTVLDAAAGEKKEIARVEKTDAQWRMILAPMQYDVLRRGGTECAFTGAYDKFDGRGLFRCAGCGNDLFHSRDKFHSGTGWPSFTRAVDSGNVILREDRSHGMVRTEVLCAVCGGHLGHVFDDGPAPTGLRFCMNSAALKFVPGE